MASDLSLCEVVIAVSQTKSDWTYVKCRPPTSSHSHTSVLQVEYESHVSRVRVQLALDTSAVASVT